MKTLTKQSYILVIALALLPFAIVNAQISSYKCDFENDAQNAEWTLSSGQMAEDIPHQWVIDTAVNNTTNGKKALYVSADNGKTASYGNITSYVIAYTDIHLEKGTYDLAFDWKATGYTLTDVDGLYVGFAEQKDFLNRTINLNSNKSTSIDQLVYTYVLNLDDPDNNAVKTKLRGRSQWNTKIAKLVSDGTPRRLFFLWLNGNSAVVPPPACIDNIEIVREGACPSPSSVYVQTDAEMNLVTVSWESTGASLYEVKAYSYATERWYTRTTSDTTMVFNSISEGKCEFYVRSICSSDLRSVPYAISQFVYYPANHCIDYLTLTDENCSYTTNFHQTTDTDSPLWAWNKGKLDFGPESTESQHVIIDDTDARDPYTGGELLKVAPNELASVRLGVEGPPHLRASRATFKYHVDAEKTPVLMMKYAVVLQEPGHDVGKPNNHQDPRFTLKVMQKNGRSVGSCAEADFTSSSVDESKGWKGFEPQQGSGLQTTHIVWKDWTSVGVNLSEYDGQDLTIQLTSFDCGQSGHFGYAYFTLGCSNGQLSGMSCGKENTEFVAPDGFVYRWYKAVDEQKVHYPLGAFNESLILGRDRVFTLTDPNDTIRYAVDMMFVGDTTCSFTLYASALPYFPVAEMKHEYKPSGCRNIYQFTNTSHTKEYNKVSGQEVHTTNKVDYVEWDFGDGTTSLLTNPEHEFPAEGGVFTVKLKAYIGDCDPDETSYTLLIPPVGPSVDTLHINACKADGYQFKDSTYFESTIIVDSLQSTIGCDSIVVYDVTVLDTIFTVIDTVIMNDEYYRFNGKDLNTQGTYRVSLKSLMGCDSIVTLNLFVHDVLRVNIDSIFTLCADDGVLHMPFVFTSGYSDTYSLMFSSSLIPNVDNAHTTIGQLDVDMPLNIEPNNYTMQLHFYDSIGGDLTIPLKLVVDYPSDILTQRWGDVLAIKNQTYNGGYEFSAFQWYKNMSPIEGATGAWLYVPGGLDLTAFYTAEVTRASDGVQLFICPIVPEAFDSQQNIPTLVPQGAQMSLQEVKEATWYNALGELLYSVKTDSNVMSLTAPIAPGVYLLHITTDIGQKKVYRVVVQ